MWDLSGYSAGSWTPIGSLRAPFENALDLGGGVSRWILVEIPLPCVYVRARHWWPRAIFTFGRALLAAVLVCEAPYTLAASPQLCQQAMELLVSLLQVLRLLVQDVHSHGLKTVHWCCC